MGKAYFILAFAALVGAVAAMSEWLVPGFPYKKDIAGAALGTLLALVAVSLFVERAMTVVNAMLYGADQRAVELGLADGSASFDDLARLLTAKERVRLLGAFLAALLVSAAGVRTLEGLLETAAPGHAPNSLLIPVDVVLTALLIAGGSNGLAYLLQVAKDRMAPAAAAAAPPPAAAAPRGRGAAGQGSVTAASAHHPRTALRARLITTG